MGTTPALGLPYVETTDPLANFPATDKANAQAVEAAIVQRARFAVSGLASPQSIPTGVVTALNLVKTADEGRAGWSVVGGALVLPDPGVWLILGWATFDVSATGQRYCYVRKNGGVLMRASGSGSREFTMMATAIVTVVTAAVDKIDVAVFQDSGAALNASNSNGGTGLQVMRISR